MSKMPGGKLEVNVKIDGMKETMDELLAFCREMADRENLREVKKDLKENNEWNDEKEIIKSEFKRVGDLMKKTKPGTEEYFNLAKSLDKLRDIIGYSF